MDVIIFNAEDGSLTLKSLKFWGFTPRKVRKSFEVKIQKDYITTLVMLIKRAGGKIC